MEKSLCHRSSKGDPQGHPALTVLCPATVHTFSCCHTWVKGSMTCRPLTDGVSVSPLGRLRPRCQCPGAGGGERRCHSETSEAVHAQCHPVVLCLRVERGKQWSLGLGWRAGGVGQRRKLPAMRRVSSGDMTCSTVHGCQH